MMQQGQLLESQRGQKQTSIFTHRVFYHEIVFDSASADLPAFFVVADTGEIELCDGKLKLYLRISVKKTKKKAEILYGRQESRLSCTLQSPTT